MKKYIQLDQTVVDLSKIDEDTGIIQTLTSNNAIYHKIYYDNFNDCHYERLIKKGQKQISEGYLYSIQTVLHKRK